MALSGATAVKHQSALGSGSWPPLQRPRVSLRSRSKEAAKWRISLRRLFPSSSAFGPVRLQISLHHGPSPSTMLRRYVSVRGCSGRRRYVVLIALLASFLLIRSLPALKSDLNSRTRIVPSEDRPRYLYHSVFRRNPDRGYEEQLSNALQEIERQQLSLNSHEDKTHTLWQIMLGLDPSAEVRGEDSLKFEKKNSEWQYSVRSQELIPIHMARFTPFGTHSTN